MRTTADIIENPLLGDTVSASDINRKGGCLHVWTLCPICGDGRWITNKPKELKRRCDSCARKYRRVKYAEFSSGQYKTIGIDDIPKEGDLIRGALINRKGNFIYKWVKCPECLEYRWQVKKAPARMCRICTEKRKTHYIGELSNNWKGGVLHSKQGYAYIVSRKDSPYYPMANTIGYIAEHRLVMAQHMGRCLERWEIVHHKNGVKLDNRLENLELLDSPFKHNTFTIMEREIKKLRTQVADLGKEVKLCKWRIKELENVGSKEVNA